MYVPALRRGVLLVAVMAFLMLAGARAAWGSGPTAYDTVTIRSGDTVWNIAAQRYPGADTREKVGEILAANDLREPALHPGQHLRVPTG